MKQEGNKNIEPQSLVGTRKKNSSATFKSLSKTTEEKKKDQISNPSDEIERLKKELNHTKKKLEKVTKERDSYKEKCEKQEKEIEFLKRRLSFHKEKSNSND